MADNKNQTQAADLAGWHGTQAATRGSELMRRPDVAARVAWLRQASSTLAVRSVAVSKGWVLQELRNNVIAATLDGDRSSVNRGLELIGKELGMFVERKVLGIQDLRKASAEEIMGLLAEVDSQLALPPGEQEIEANVDKGE